MPQPPSLDERSLEALIDELAKLAAELWFEGKLEDLAPSEEHHGEDEG